MVGAGNGAVNGGPGIWDASTGNWTTDGGANNIAWNYTNNDVAVFGGAAGSVAIAVPVTAGGLTFNSTGYSVTGSTLTLGEISSGGGNVVLSGAGNITINGAIAGTSGGLTVDHFGNTGVPAGTMTFKGADTYAGTITVTNGILSMEGNRTTASGEFIIGDSAA